MFIVIEGPDGSGKTTISKLLVERLNDIGIKARYTSEPTASHYGKRLREMLSDSSSTPKELYESIVKVLDDKKAEEIAVLDTTDLTVVSEYFVIATGNSSTHVKSLADDVEYELQQLGIEPEHIEGRATGWILLDYGSVLLHVFTRDNRDYYNLEHLWADAKQVDISGLVTE